MAEGKTGLEVCQKLVKLGGANPDAPWLRNKAIIYDPDTTEQMEVQTIVVDSKQQLTFIIRRK